MDQLYIEVIPDGRAVTLVLNGDLDASAVGAVRACLHNLDTEWRSVVLEMAGVTFIDSSGIALLLQAHRDFAIDFRSFELRSLNVEVQRILELSGATEFVPTAAPI